MRTESRPEAIFRRYLTRRAVRVDAALDRLLPAERTRPALIHRAMRYTALSPGKRLRPVLVLLAYETCGGTGRKADAVAAALEMVHAFSLIHDDLPAMDNDDMRRGRPSNHKVFGEDVAILAGDGLLTQAFEVLADCGRSAALGPRAAMRLVAELSRATGSQGVIGGQVMDVASEGKRVSRATVEYIHLHKTARLFAGALRLGAIAANASPARIAALGSIGEHAGMAFQIVDDVLSAAGDARRLGREAGRDEEMEKVTFPSTLGFPASHRAVDRALSRAARRVGRLPAHQPEFTGFLELVDRRRRDSEGRLLGMAGS